MVCGNFVAVLAFWQHRCNGEEAGQRIPNFRARRQFQGHRPLSFFKLAIRQRRKDGPSLDFIISRFDPITPVQIPEET